MSARDPGAATGTSPRPLPAACANCPHPVGVHLGELSDDCFYDWCEQCDGCGCECHEEEAEEET